MTNLLLSIVLNFMIISPNATTKTDTLNLNEFRTNKKIPKVIEHSILMALSHYPELKETPIDFVFKKDIKKSIMQAQPKFNTMLKGKKKRGYQINISSMFKLTHSVTPIHQIPEDIMIGWIGHELGHVMDYRNRSTIGMMLFGIGYLFSEKQLVKAEIAADTFAVTHGLGNYIIATKKFILDNSDLPEVYKARIAKLYLSPIDIIEKIKELEQAKEKGEKIEVVK